VLAIAHDDDYDPGFIGERAEHHGMRLELFRRELDGAYPDPRDFDLVLPLGSAWSVTDDALTRYVLPEQELLRRAMDHDVPVLAICFGAQQLAAAMGGAVQRAERPELGWYEIDTSAPDLVPAGPWFQFHFDIVTPPPGADVFASTALCPQAFRMGRALAVQFHPEVTVEIITRWSGPSVHHLPLVGHTLESLLAESTARMAQHRANAHRLFDRFLTEVAGT
jgi:GMP synthase-like glutamine amidotransferase